MNYLHEGQAVVGVKKDIMIKIFIFLIILFFPFMVMIIVNEYVRLNSDEGGYTVSGVTAINTSKKQPDECTWICHNNTSYCKEKHVKFAKPYFNSIDPIYFGIIGSLRMTGNYRLANIVFLVIVMPLIMYILLVKSISIQIQIRRLKKES